MSQPFLGQIMPVAFDFAPKGFAFCNGQLMPIAQHQAVFALLGTNYGGNGTTNFALPNLQSRTPVGSKWGGDNVGVGGMGGVENVALLPTQLPAHNHTFNANSAPATVRPPGNGVFGSTGQLKIYGSSGGPQVPLDVLDNAGQASLHPNMQPYTVLNFCIALNGVFPSRS